MAASLAELLLPQVVVDVISRIRLGRGPISAWLGFCPDAFEKNTVSVSGPNTLRGSLSVRNYTYRIFDNTRVPLKARAPGTGPGTVAANPMGQNTVSVARYHQKIPLQYEFLGNLSPMIGPNSQIDPAGQDYVMRQEQFLVQQGNMMVEMMGAAMLRDSLYFIQSGDNWLPTFTAPTAAQVGFQVPFLVPANSKGQLPNQMGTSTGGGNLIDVSWNNPNANIIQHLLKIIAAYVQLSGYPMTDVWINSILWSFIIQNTSVRNTAGSLNTPFAEYDRVPQPGMRDSGPSNRFSAILKGQPNVRWNFCDDVIALSTDVDPSYLSQPSGSVPAGAVLSKEVPDNTAIFSTEPAGTWTKMYLGGEYVVENPGQVGALRMGWYAWHEYVTQPSAIDLCVLLNAVPALYVPLAVAPAVVVF